MSHRQRDDRRYVVIAENWQSSLSRKDVYSYLKKHQIRTLRR
jgi:hypothetical protein